MSVKLDKMAWDQCEGLCQAAGLERASVGMLKNELHYQALTDMNLIQMAEWLADKEYFLVTLVANDEQGLRDSGRFCLYYVFSHPATDLFLWISYVPPSNEETYPSLRPYFASVEPFEREIYDLLGLRPRDQPLSRNHGARLHHGCYPEQLYPLRRDRSLSEIRQAVRDHYFNNCTLPLTWQSNSSESDKIIPDGEMLVPVGPVHAGTIEPGHFLFHLDGEKVRQLDITLGYKHKGIERLFQEYTIQDQRSVQLAEFISSDSAFAHSLAYCRAVENLTDVVIPSPVRIARRLFLEIERISNHIGDCGALAHDVGLDVIASDMSMLRERMLELCQETAGHRLLMGVNRPGGIMLPAPVDPQCVGNAVQTIVKEFALQCHKLTRKRLWRRRTQGVGRLKEADAWRLGTTGMVARASGIVRDFRLTHPDTAGVYSPLALRRCLLEKYSQGLDDALFAPGRVMPTRSQELMATPVMRWQSAQLDGSGSLKKDAQSYGRHLLTYFVPSGMRDGNEPGGDIYERFRERVRQVEISALWAAVSLRRWRADWHEQRYKARHITPDSIRRQLAMGYAEGWRGEVVYWLMVDPSGQIYRCKVRDPSMLNWPALEEAVRGNYLSDFPLINKSFNLSYAGNDL